MKSRTAAWLAWSMCLMAAAAIAGALAGRRRLLNGRIHHPGHTGDHRVDYRG